MSDNAGPLSVLHELQILAEEVHRRRILLVAVFAFIALAALVVGSVWPRTYTSATTILVQEDNIIQPLMEGTAVATAATDRGRIAREVIFSRRILNAVLAEGGWNEASLSPLEIEHLVEELKQATAVRAAGPNIIEIAYRDSDPERALRVTRKYAELFIAESLAAKERESREAYEFIAARVDEYHRKLTTAEDNLTQFRADNQDARPGTATDVNTRVAELRTRIETAQTDLSALQMRERTLQEQLSGEAEVTASQGRETQFRTRLTELQAELDRLLLSYTDDYPDVVRVRHQIDDLQNDVAEERARREAVVATGQSPGPASDAVLLNPLYQQLRSELSTVRADAAALRARVAENDALLEGEFERGRRVADSEATLAELTRDYEVNRDLYQDLLRRRENARVSMSLDAEHRGLTMRIQEPAALPQIPSGLRFMHFALAGLGLGFAAPIGLAFAAVKLDPRVRSVATLTHDLSGVPVLVSIPRFLDSHAMRRERLATATVMVVMLATLGAYAAVAWQRVSGAV